MLRWLLSLLIAIGITGCGFQPRTPLPLAPPLHNLYLQSHDPYGQLTHNLVNYFNQAHVHLASNPAEADTTLDIMHEDMPQQMLSVGGTQQTRQYNLVLAVTFELLNKNGRVIIPPTTVTQTRTIPIQSNQILGDSNQAANLYLQMRQAIVYDIANRLASNQVTYLLMNSR